MHIINNVHVDALVNTALYRRIDITDLVDEYIAKGLEADRPPEQLSLT